MKRLLLTLQQSVAFRAFLLRRLARYTVAEGLFLVAQQLPTVDMLWNAVFRLNPYHVPAALARAHALQQQRDPRAATAFQVAQQRIQNTARVSASDLALTLVPGRLLQRIFRRDALAKEHQLQEMYRALAGESAAITDVTPPSNSICATWTHIETLWREREYENVLQLVAPLIQTGTFVSPLDSLTWSRRLLSLEEPTTDHHMLAAHCLEWAKQWIPERALTWFYAARLAQVQNDFERAALYLERALLLEPDNYSAFFVRQNLHRATPLRPVSDARLRVTAPASLGLYETAVLECVLENSADTFQLHVLAPSGYGIVATPRQQTISTAQPTRLQIRAARPDRINGKPWKLSLAAVSATEIFKTEISIVVPDTARGQLLVVVTEDHELWEERGILPRADIQKLLVQKSEFAAAQYSPWTHMVEVGTSLALLDWAAHTAPTATLRQEWSETREAARAHLQAQVKSGNDVQPHLHAFNLPNSPAFPFHISDKGIEPDPFFLLTAEEYRRDFARAYPPQERIKAVAETVARLETLAHTADPNYRAVLWRSGQLEFGDDPADRAWSAVALLRAGLFADSDLAKKTFPWNILPRTAYFAALDDPFVPALGGELVQLPVTANLEGDFLSDARTLQEIAKRAGDALRDQPGVHVVTLLTHDKFINARRDADEFSLDPAYNEWATIRVHLAAWDAAGAQRVTARQAIQVFLDDGTWHLTAWLQNETWRSDSHVRYTVLLLGKNIPVSDEYPHWVLITIPPFLRENVLSVCVLQNDAPVPLDQCSTDHFWVRVTAREPALYCEFDLRLSFTSADAVTETSEVLETSEV